MTTRPLAPANPPAAPRRSRKSDGAASVQLAQLRRNAEAAGNVRAVAAIDRSRYLFPIRGDHSMCVRVDVDTPSILNRRMHWAALASLKKRQRKAVYTALHWYVMTQGFPLPALPVRVTLTRMFGGRNKALDAHDNLPASLKACVDEVAATYGVPDNDPQLTWKAKQNRADAAPSCVLLMIEPVRPAPAEATP
jgi:hypothetical protein